MAKAMAAQGASVAIQDIDVEVAATEAGKINQAGGRAVAIGGDICDLKQAQIIVEQTLKLLGSVDILINNAAIQRHQHWTQESVEDIQKQFDADLLAPILYTRAAVVHMKERKWGRVINLGSIQQRGANPGMLPYSLSKGAMEKLTKALARDLAKDNITVNCIAPGWINTYRNRNDFPSEEEIKNKGKHVPLGRIGQPEDFGGIAVLLCSNAGSYITGQTIFVDGGMSAW